MRQPSVCDTVSDVKKCSLMDFILCVIHTHCARHSLSNGRFEKHFTLNLSQQTKTNDDFLC